jgi:predicted ATP-dependent endonuclease of OLD family
LKAEAKNNVTAKNLSDLRKQYDADPSQYQFLKQYLTISRAEIFFADKAVLIEGDTERILIPTFMRKVDLEEGFALRSRR